MSTIVPDLRNLMTTAIERDPLVFNKSLEVQFISLIVNPINPSQRPGFTPSSIPLFTIIDALDECSGSRIQTRIFEVLFKAVQKCDMPLRVFIASRPEVDISKKFKHDPHCLGFNSTSSRRLVQT